MRYLREKERGNNMKKIFLILLVIASTLLLACGRDTKDWPRISLPFEREAINQIEISHFDNEKKEDYTITEKEIINYIYSDISFPYKKDLEKESSIKKWKIKIDIIFVIDNFSSENYEVILYNSGICNGYVHLNGEEIHFLPGDIESFYEKIVEKINKED